MRPARIGQEGSPQIYATLNVRQNAENYEIGTSRTRKNPRSEGFGWIKRTVTR
jgi:hypothetical protein